MLSCKRNQGRESIRSVTYVTSGKVKTSVQQSPCAFGRGDSPCAAALGSIPHQAGELSVRQGGLSPVRNQGHPSLPVPRQPKCNMGIINTIPPSLKPCISPNSNFYILYTENTLLQILVSHDLHIEFQGEYLMECMPQLLYVCTISKGHGNLA